MSSSTYQTGLHVLVSMEKPRTAYKARGSLSGAMSEEQIKTFIQAFQHAHDRGSLSGAIPYNLLTTKGVQEALNAIDLQRGAAGPPIREDGIRDQATDSAIRAFQRAHDIDPDGSVGVITRAYLLKDLLEVKLVEPLEAKAAAIQEEARSAEALPAQAKETLEAVKQAADRAAASAPSQEQVSQTLRAMEEAAKGARETEKEIGTFLKITAALGGAGLLYLFMTRRKLS